MVRYFEKGLKLSIKAKIDQNATHLDNYEELVAKAVRVEVKAGLRPSFYVQEIDLQVLRGSRLAHTIAHKVQTQGTSRGDDSKAFKALVATQESEPFDKARKDKKKRHHKDKRNSREPKDYTSTSGINKAKINGGGKKRRNKKDVSEITYFNCNKKGHYSNKCPEPPKN